jgi:hypothetical protein
MQKPFPQATTAIVVALCGLLVLSSAVSMAQVVAPQQSTTGPVPPPSVPAKSQMVMLSPAQGSASKTISGVPGYAWRHGCGPTALGMVLGYYDGQGFSDLFPGDAATQTSDVDQGIASEGSGTRGSGAQKHYEDYSLPDDSAAATPIPDSSETYPTGCHANDSIADFMHTSWSYEDNFYGWSWSNSIGLACVLYVTLQNDGYVPSVLGWDGSLPWSVLTSEIDNNRPMVFLVDTDGNGGTDHFVTVVGYSDGPPRQYGCLDTWYPYDEVRWCQFRTMASGVPWGVWGGWAFRLQFSLEVSAVNGSVDKSPNRSAFDSGESVTLTPHPDPARYFAGWSGDVPAGHAMDEPLVLTMNANKSLTATFSVEPPLGAKNWEIHE